MFVVYIWNIENLTRCGKCMPSPYTGNKKSARLIHVSEGCHRTLLGMIRNLPICNILQLTLNVLHIDIWLDTFEGTEQSGLDESLGGIVALPLWGTWFAWNAPKDASKVSTLHNLSEKIARWGGEWEIERHDVLANGRGNDVFKK